MSPIQRLNTVSKSYTGNTLLEVNLHRGYFFIVFTEGSGTIEFGDGGGKIPLELGFHYAPTVAPTSKISVESTGGTYVIHEA